MTSRHPTEAVERDAEPDEGDEEAEDIQGGGEQACGLRRIRREEKHSEGNREQEEACPREEAGEPLPIARIRCRVYA